MSSKYMILPIGGGITPEGTLDITSEGTYDVTEYAQVDVDIFDDTTTKTIDDNGVYNAGDEGVLGYSQVTVQVPASAVTSGTKSITTNGTQDVTEYKNVDVQVPNGTETKDITDNGIYTPTSPNIGFSRVSVDVPASAVTSGTKSITVNGTFDVTEYKNANVQIAASEVTSGTKDITANGEYDVTEYQNANVRVPNGTETLSATQNTTYVPTSPNIGFSQVTVNVPASAVTSGTLNITSEGDYDVTEYAEVSVDIFNDTGTKTITDNGVYDAGDDHLIGYSQVTVQVPASAVDSGTKQTSITSNGTTTVDVIGYASNEISVNVQPALQNKSVTPTTSSQTIEKDSGYYGLGTVTVGAVTSSIDNNITAGNIKSGVSILGVTGDYDPQPTLDTLNVTPSTTSQTITPTGGVDGYDEVNVSAVDSSIDPNILSNNIKNGVTILGITGSYTAQPNLQSKTENPSTSVQYIQPDGGYDGLSEVTINPVTAAIDNNITAGNIKDGVTILGVTGSYDNSCDLETLNVTPTTSAQTITSQNKDGFDEVNVSAVTSSIDANITAGNIKDGVTILGVTGSYDPQPNLDTLNVTPSTTSQTLTPTSPVDGFDEVVVSAVTSSIDANITAGNIKDGVTILGVQGTYDNASTLGSINVTPTTSAQQITPSGVDGYDEINVAAVTSSIDSNITAGNIKNGVTILGVQGTYDNASTLGTLSVTPTTSAQTITPTGGYDGYDEINVSAVTSSIDANIVAGNIKDGVTILGVEGTYEGGGQTIPDVLCFTSNDDGSEVEFNSGYREDIVLYSSTDGVTYDEWDGSLVVLDTGETLYVYGDNEYLNDKKAYETGEYAYFAITGDVTATGRVDTLLNRNGVTELTPYCFASLFDGCEGLTGAAPELPPIAYAPEYVYICMFQGSGITEVTYDLTALALGDSCYNCMFGSCASLETVPSTMLPSTELAEGCYSDMFMECTSLQTAPNLPAKVCKSNCYDNMFSNCESLATAPVIGAEVLAERCMGNMFMGCTSLRTGPELKARKLAKDCYKEMFQDCSSLEYVTVHAREWNEDWCNNWLYGTVEEGGVSISVYNEGLYKNNVFTLSDSAIPSGWTPVFNYTEPLCFTSLEDGSTVSMTIPVSMAETVQLWTSDDGVPGDQGGTWTSWDGSEITLDEGEKVYINGYNPNGLATSTATGNYCQFVMTGTISASGDLGSLIHSYGCNYIPNYGFADLFKGCTSLVKAPELPANNVGGRGYSDLFSNCTSIEDAPELPAMNLGAYSYYAMFYKCSGLVKAPDVLPAETVPEHAYTYMFSNCTTLARAPFLPCRFPGNLSYTSMFSECSNLQEVKVGASALTTNMSNNWLNNVSATGTLYLPKSTLYSFLPGGWTRVNYEDSEIPDFQGYIYREEDDIDFLCFTSNQDNSTVSFIKYQTVVEDTNNQPVLYKSTDGELFELWQGGQVTLNAGDKLWVFGDNETIGGYYFIPGSGSGTWNYRHFNITGSVSASGRVDSLLNRKGVNVIPAYAFYYLFNGCTGLTTAPEMPDSDIVGRYGCADMFKGCTSLVKAPELPATRVMSYGYYYMFSGCSSLTKAPSVLPAQRLSSSVYYGMFYNCTSLVRAPEIAGYITNGGTTSSTSKQSENCFYNMFKGCSSLKYIKVGSSTWNTNYATDWVLNVGSGGMFYKPNDTTIATGNNGIPSGWTTVNI